MKIVLTESQYKNILSHYLNKIIDSPEFDFVDNIEIIEGSTGVAGWNKEHEKPYYEYIVHVNYYQYEQTFEKSKRDLYDRIGDTHTILFPINDDGTPSAYYSINTEFN